MLKGARDLLLFDYYKTLLSPRQCELYELYFQEDYSLVEIAARMKITRQAVYDLLRRTRRNLERYEQRLQLINNDNRLRKEIIKLKKALPAGALNAASRKQLEKLQKMI